MEHDPSVPFSEEALAHNEGEDTASPSDDAQPDFEMNGGGGVGEEAQEEELIATQEGSQREKTEEAETDYDRLKVRVHKNAHDADTWHALIDAAEASADIERVKEAYELLLEVYPNAPAAQIAYLQHFLSPGLFQVAEQLFSRFLRPSPSVELWKFYLVYVRRLNTDPSTREIVKKAYEFTLNHVGQDKDSGEIWKDYIDFLNAGEASNTREEQLKMDALRRVYHRAVQIPLENVETLWRELDAFENRLNKITAKKFLGDLSPAHQQARQALREMRTKLSPIQSANSMLKGRLQLPQPLGREDRQLVRNWLYYLKWEESNPLDLDEKDKSLFQTRMQLVYRHAVVKMRFCPDIWYMAYFWTLNNAKQEEAIAILKQGMTALPFSYLLTLAYCEIQEQLKNLDDVNATYNKFIESLQAELESLERAQQAQNSKSDTLKADQDAANDDEDAPYDPNAPPPNLVAAAQPSAPSSTGSNNVQELTLLDRKQELGIVWISYMKFARRSESQKSARAVFSKFRKTKKWITWEVFEAAALMEYHCSKDAGVAKRIYENGLGHFGDEIEFVDRYLGFLISINDESNARALFERAIPSFPGPRGQKLWDRWSRYEYLFSDLEAVHKLEKRIYAEFKDAPNTMYTPIKLFSDRHKYGPLDAIASRDMAFGIRTRTLTRHDTSTMGLQPRPSQVDVTTSGAGGGPLSPPAEKDRKRTADSQAAPTQLKRQRPLSPPRDRERERERDREREREREMRTERERDRDFRERDMRERGDRWGERRRAPSPDGGYRNGSPARRPVERTRDQDRAGAVPPAVLRFMSTLPAPHSFDGPVFRIDDLMQIFRNAVVPGAPGAAPAPAPPPPMRNRSPIRGGGRPPPDYSAYRGPNDGPPRRY